MSNSTQSTLNRRDFLRHSTTAAAAFAFPLMIGCNALPKRGQPGPNDRIQIGFIGRLAGIFSKYNSSICQ